MIDCLWHPIILDVSSQKQHCSTAVAWHRVWAFKCWTPLAARFQGRAVLPRT